MLLLQNCDALELKKVGIYVAHHLYNTFNLDYSKSDFHGFHDIQMMVCQ